MMRIIYPMCITGSIIPSIRIPVCVIINIYNGSPWSPPSRAIIPSPGRCPYGIIGAVDMPDNRPIPDVYGDT
jgi:hypothetical protein